jgi:hypothetical protein
MLPAKFGLILPRAILVSDLGNVKQISSETSLPN